MIWAAVDWLTAAALVPSPPHVLPEVGQALRGGVVVALAKQLPVSIPFIGVGEGINDLQPFQSVDFARALVGGNGIE